MTPEEPGGAVPPAPDEPAPPAPPSPAAGPPAWTFFLTPAAVLIGALIIAAAIWWQPADDEAASPAATPPPAGMSTMPAASPTTAAARTLVDTFLGYARSLQLDEGRLMQCLNDPQNVQLINAHLQRGSQLGVSGTPTFFINNKKLVGAQPTALMLEIIEKERSPNPPTSIDAYSPQLQQLAATNPPSFAIVEARPDLSGAAFEGNPNARVVIVEARPDLSGAAFEGNPNARVVIAEFSDFQCPFCKRWNETTLGEVRKLLGDEVALAFLHFPIAQIHPNAGNASLLAICAGAQGKFWEMHDLLFARQDEWANLR